MKPSSDDGKQRAINTFKHRLINDGMIPFNVRNVLDVGCERGLTGALLQRTRDLDQMAGMDIFEPYLDDVREHGYYTDVYQFDLNSGKPFPFKDDSFDCAVCIDVFEHLKDKDAGFHVASEMERVARRSVIAMPSCLMTHPDFDDNPHQRHRIIFKPSEFRKLGYRVIGVGPILLHMAGRYVCLPFESWPISTAFPSLSLTFVCVKDRSGSEHDVSQERNAPVQVHSVSSRSDRPELRQEDKQIRCLPILQGKRKGVDQEVET